MQIQIAVPCSTFLEGGCGVTLQLGFAVEASCVQPAWYGIKQQVPLHSLCK